MMSVTAEDSRAVPAHGSTSCLLQLPEAALAVVLQKLEPYSRASTAMSCTALSHAVPSNISTAVVSCTRPNTTALYSFTAWADRHSSSLTQLERCGIECLETWRPQDFSEIEAVLQQLPCPGLRELRLQGLKLQLYSAAGLPGVLGACTALTSLSVQSCMIFDTPAASAAIAALSELRQLSLDVNWDQQGSFILPADNLATALTQLSLVWPEDSITIQRVVINQSLEQLTQLSALVNLEHLLLSKLPGSGVPGGLPSQLVKLTCLDVQYLSICDMAVQLQQLSGLTALRRLRFECAADESADIGSFPGITHLTHITSLDFDGFGLHMSAASTTTWARLTALHSLMLWHCELQPAALVSLPQLQSLSLRRVQLCLDATAQDFLYAMSHLTVLTQLEVCLQCHRIHAGQPAAPAATFTSLTASTHLCSLVLDLDDFTPNERELFKPGTVYPHMRLVQLETMVPSHQELQQLCTCCPALERLSILLSQPARDICLPLLQLSALTSLQVAADGAAEAGSAAEGLFALVGQLTGLESLNINTLHPQWHMPSTAPLLKLTALTALESLDVEIVKPRVRLINKAGPHSPPDLWIQLLRRLLRDAACRQALLQRSPAAAAAPAELMLAQLAATLAEELATACLKD